MQFSYVYRSVLDFQANGSTYCITIGCQGCTTISLETEPIKAVTQQKCQEIKSVRDDHTGWKKNEKEWPVYASRNIFEIASLWQWMGICIVFFFFHFIVLWKGDWFYRIVLQREMCRKRISFLFRQSFLETCKILAGFDASDKILNIFLCNIEKIRTFFFMQLSMNKEIDILM